MLLTFQLYGSLDVLKMLPGVLHSPLVTLCAAVCVKIHTGRVLRERDGGECVVGWWEMNANHTACHGILPFSVQGSIQQLVLKSDPTAPDDQCEEDDPYVSVRPDKRANPSHKFGSIPPSSGRMSVLQ